MLILEKVTYEVAEYYGSIPSIEKKPKPNTFKYFKGCLIVTNGNISSIRGLKQNIYDLYIFN